MRSVFIAGSRKFFDEIEGMVKKLKNKKIKVSTTGEWDKTKKDTFENQKEALLIAFQEIDSSDVIYIYSKNGYIGKTVAMEIAYAYAKKKEIISFDRIEELSAQALVTKVLSEKELIEYCK